MGTAHEAVRQGTSVRIGKMASTVSILLLSLVVGCSSQQSSNTLTIVAVVDHAFSHVASQMQAAVDDVNSRDTSSRMFVMETIYTQDNDSFGAMDEMCTKVTDGIAVIVDMSSRHVTAAMRSLSDAMGIAHVSGLDQSYESTSRVYNLSANVRAPASRLLQSIRDIVSTEENITSAAIIYDMSFDLTDKPKRLLRNIPTQHMYLQMATGNATIDEQLAKLKSSNLFHLFLAGTAENVARYLGRANEDNMMNYKYSWYVITMDEDMPCPQCLRSASFVTLIPKKFEPQSFVELRPVYPEGGSLAVDSVFTYEVMTMVGEALQRMVTSGSWVDIVYTDCFSLVDTDPQAKALATALADKVASTNYLGVYGEYEWHGREANQRLEMDIFRNSVMGGEVDATTLIGNWSTTGGVSAFDGTITNRDVTKTYRVITIKEPPFIFREKEPPPPNINYYYNETTGDYYYGYCIDLIFEINSSLHFEFTLAEPADNSYGTMQPNGSWNGMVRELMEDRADIIVAPFSVMAERENVIDFTVPFYDLVGITILMKKPTFTYEVFKFMNVLENSVWGCIFSAFLLVSILLAVFDRLSPFSSQNNRHDWPSTGEDPRVFSLKEGLWFCMTSLTPQGGGEAPRALSGRLVAATWWMFGFIMIATYTANLAAFLTVSRLDQPIGSLDDLAAQFQIKYAPQQSTATETYFKRMAEIEDKFYDIWKSMSLNDSLSPVERAQLAVWDYPVSDKFTNMWTTMQETILPRNFEEAIQRIKNPNNTEGGFAFIADATRNKYLARTDCELWEVGEEFSRKPYALAVQQGSPLKNALSGHILTLLNQRTLESLKTKWWDFNRVDCPAIEDESDGISIQNIGGVFIVIFIGIGLGLITLVFEYYWYRWRPEARKGRSDDEKTEKDGGTGHKSTYENKGYIT